ncbi:hypothetical protein [Streptomyces boluensis]|uniref:Uncharacterized protein n=1 Tax=Streptomyces boluensis TaxID=1775135 RepID=A0A964UNW7_9ACTN|nr:hypothetical protein [Streptomyces boluensis]NBE52724.1 hypothetical protein [Streptomyces boluensis]
MVAGEYEVYGAGGEPLGRIERRKGRLVPWPRRRRWSVLSEGAGRDAVGKAGSWYSWAFYVLLSPLWVPLWLALILFALLDGDTDVSPGVPRRVRWFGADGALVLDRHGRGVYRIPPGGMDVRIAYAVALVVAA